MGHGGRRAGASGHVDDARCGRTTAPEVLPVRRGLARAIMALDLSPLQHSDRGPDCPPSRACGPPLRRGTKRNHGDRALECLLGHLSELPAPVCEMFVDPSFGEGWAIVFHWVRLGPGDGGQTFQATV